MSWILNFTNVLGRIYRPTIVITEAKMPLWSDYEDIYGEDKHLRIMPSTEAIINLGARSAPDEIATAILERTVDIGPGFVIEAKKLRTVGGVREAVTANVSSAVSATDTDFTVDEIYGFEAGDLCVIQEGSTFDLFKLKSATGTTLSTYSDMASDNAYTTAADIAVKSLWMVTSELIPQLVGPYHKVMVTKVPGWWRDT